MENLSPQIIRQLTKELHELVTEPPEGIKVQINEEDITDIQAYIDGPGLFSIPFLSSLTIIYGLRGGRPPLKFMPTVILKLFFCFLQLVPHMQVVFFE